MYTELTKRFKEKVDREKPNLKQLAVELNIKYDRMYKWLMGKGNPKPPEDRIIENWISGIKSIVPKISDGNVAIKRTTVAHAFGEIEERLVRVEAQTKVLQATLINLLSKDPSDFARIEKDLAKAVENEINKRFDELNK